MHSLNAKLLSIGIQDESQKMHYVPCTVGGSDLRGISPVDPAVLVQKIMQADLKPSGLERFVKVVLSRRCFYMHACTRVRALAHTHTQTHTLLIN